jgi:hypothetical protein
MKAFSRLYPQYHLTPSVSEMNQVHVRRVREVAASGYHLNWGNRRVLGKAGEWLKNEAEAIRIRFPLRDVWEEV